MASSDTRERWVGLQIGDPISGDGGSLNFRLPLLDLGGIPPLRWFLTYHLSAAGGTPDQGFLHSPLHVLQYITFTGRFVLRRGDTGDSVTFRKVTGGGWECLAASRTYAMKETGSGLTSGWYYVMDPIDELVWIFEKLADSQTRLRYALDRNGNYLTYLYASNPNLPDAIFEGEGGPGARKVLLTHRKDSQNVWRVSSVTERVWDSALGQEVEGRSVAFGVGNQCGDSYREVLCTVTDAAGGIHAFRYTYVDGAWVYGMTEHALPRGNKPRTQVVENRELSGTSGARVVSQIGADGSTLSVGYNEWATKVTPTWPDGSQETYWHMEELSPPRYYTDATGKTVNFSQNYGNQWTKVVDRLGDATGATYHPETGKVLSLANPLGGTVSFTYAACEQTVTNPAARDSASFTFYDLSRIDWPGGTHEEFTGDGRGNVVAWVDRAGQTWTATCDARGLPLTETNPAAGTATCTYNPDGTLASRQGPDTGAWTFAYDRHKRVTRITQPGGSRVDLSWDALDRMTSLTDEDGGVWSFGHDANGNPTSTADPSASQALCEYDLMDRPIRFTDRLGHVTHYSYDNMGRVSSVTDPNGQATQYGYDPRGWVNRVTAGGQTWQTSYDDEGAVAASAVPSGRTWTFQSDERGLLSRFTDPLGLSSDLAWDPLGHLTGVTDPLGRVHGLAYGPDGELSGASWPLVGGATYARESRGLLQTLSDLNGNDWVFAYTAGGRLQGLTDPLGRIRGQAWNERGELARITYPGGETRDITYDAAGNVVRDLFSSGADLAFAYDPLGRLTVADGVALEYDAEGRVTRTTQGGIGFGASYDGGGRLETLTYAGGAVTVSYAYDAVTGLLARVSDDLSGAWVEFEYDLDRRLTGIRRSNGIDTIRDYDDADRLTRIRDGSFLDIRYALDGAGQVVQADVTAPLDPLPFLANGEETTSYDAACQASSPPYACDARGRMTASPVGPFLWDGASRLVGAGGASLVYTGLGDIASRTEGGTTTALFCHHALPLQPLVAERDGDGGNFLRYYVWGPAGDLLYLVDAQDGGAPRFYHFDGDGSTRALSDAAGAVTDAYAYLPYGRRAAHTGTSPQPFTFHGRWGCRQEGASGGLYQMGARWYDGELGRFLTPEPLWPNLAEPRALNPYAFALGNPVSYRDPTGLGPEGRPMPFRFHEILYERWQSAGMLPYAERALKDFKGDLARKLLQQAWASADGGRPYQVETGDLQALQADILKLQQEVNVLRARILRIDLVLGIRDIAKKLKKFLEKQEDLPGWIRAQLPDLLGISGTEGSTIPGMPEILIAAPGAEVCSEVQLPGAGGRSLAPGLESRVPRAALDEALRDPAGVPGYGAPSNPRLPLSPQNPERRHLDLKRPDQPYHPLFNGVVWKCGCP